MLTRTDENDGVVVVGRMTADETLRAGGCPTAVTNRRQFLHMLCACQQDRQGSKRFPTKIKIEARQDHALACIGKFLHQVRQGVIKELGLIDGHDLDVFTKRRADGFTVIDGSRLERAAGMAGYRDGVVAIIDGGFEDLHHLLGNHGTGHTPNELLGLPAEHGACDDLDPTSTEWMCLHDGQRTAWSAPAGVGSSA